MKLSEEDKTAILGFMAIFSTGIGFSASCILCTFYIDGFIKSALLVAGGTVGTPIAVFLVYFAGVFLYNFVQGFRRDSKREDSNGREY